MAIPDASQCPWYYQADVLFRLFHCGLSIWFTLNAIHGVDPQPAVPHNEKVTKYVEDKSPWVHDVHDGKAVAQIERSFGNESWNHSNAALLSAKPPFGVHDAGSHSSISLSAISMQESPQFLEIPREAPSPALLSTSHFGPSTGNLVRNPFLSSPSESKLQRMEFPDPVKIDPASRASDFNHKISPLSIPQRPYSRTSTPNFSRPVSRGVRPSFPMPDQYSFYPSVTHSNAQVSPTRSPGLSRHSVSGQLPSGRPRTADIGKQEPNLTALPPIPPPMSVRRSRSGWI